MTHVDHLLLLYMRTMEFLAKFGSTTPTHGHNKPVHGSPLLSPMKPMLPKSGGISMKVPLPFILYKEWGHSLRPQYLREGAQDSLPH